MKVPKADSEIIRATIPTTGPGGKGYPHLDFKGQDYHPAEPPGQGPCKKLHRQGSTRAKRQGHPIEPWAWCHNHPHSMSREGGTGAPVGVDGWASNQRGLICHGICPATYCTCLRTNTPSSFLFLPLGMGITILWLFHHCVLEAHN